MSRLTSLCCWFLVFFFININPSGQHLSVSLFFSAVNEIKRFSLGHILAVVWGELNMKAARKSLLVLSALLHIFTQIFCCRFHKHPAFLPDACQ